jgi:hypothetical protein
VLASRTKVTTPASNASRLEEATTLLGRSIGLERARSLLHDAAEELGFGSVALSQEQVEAVLQSVASMPGLVGVAAKMIRTRLRMASLQCGLPERRAEP